MEITRQLTFSPAIAKKILRFTGELWFLLAFIGQWIFMYYVFNMYGVSTAQGNLEAWNEGMPHGYVAGDLMGNIAAGVHVLIVIIILLGGPLQLIPQVRQYAPKFHRLNGKIYLFNGFLVSLSGLYLVWVRGTVGGLFGHLGITLNALLIMGFGIMAWRTAVARAFDQHYKWTLRLFLVMSGVWFFRIGMMFWLLWHGEAVGFDPDTVSGPFITFLIFGQFLIPLGVLELYFYAKKNGGPTEQLIMALGMFVLILMTGVGIFGATMGMWWPRIHG